MGYPSEIPNAIPERQAPPARGRLARIVARLGAAFSWLRRRKRRREDAPGHYGQGVDRAAPPVQAAERAGVDYDELGRRLTGG